MACIVPWQILHTCGVWVGFAEVYIIFHREGDFLNFDLFDQSYKIYVLLLNRL